MFGSSKKKNGSQPVPLDKGPLGGMAMNLSQSLISVGIDGKGAFDSAREVAQAALADHPADPERAVDQVVWRHRKLAASAGFVTSLGGFVTMVVALPANLLGFYLLNTRMVAAIAHLRGYDLTDRATRTAILLTLVGGDSEDLLKKAGVVHTGRLANLAANQLPPPAVMVVNKAVGFQLVGQLSDKLLTKLGKGLPVAGGVLGAGIDVVLMNRIAKGAKSEFVPTGRPLPPGRR